MHQKIQNPKTREELSGMIDKELIMYCYDTGLLFFKQYDYSSISRNKFITLCIKHNAN